MNIDVSDELKSIGSINAKYLVVTGAMRIGRFYAACQKVVSACLDKKVMCAIYCLDLDYAREILCDICGDNMFTIGRLSSAKWFKFKNGSYCLME
jgi:hypothetical protein